jgi:hypothetical protein
VADKLWRVEVEYIDEDVSPDVIKEVNYVKAESESEVVEQFDWAKSLFVTQASALEVEAYDSGYIEGWDSNEDYRIAKERLDAYDGTASRIVDFGDDFDPVFEKVFTCGICRVTLSNMSLISGKKIPVEGYKTMWNVCQSCSDIVDALDE